MLAQMSIFFFEKKNGLISSYELLMTKFADDKYVILVFCYLLQVIGLFISCRFSLRDIV